MEYTKEHIEPLRRSINIIITAYRLAGKGNPGERMHSAYLMYKSIGNELKKESPDMDKVNDYFSQLTNTLYESD